MSRPPSLPYTTPEEMGELPSRDGYRVSTHSRFAEDLADRIAPWDSDADVKRIALAAGLPTDADTIREAREILRANHVDHGHGIRGWGDGE